MLLQDYYSADCKEPEPLLKGLDSWVDGVIGRYRRRSRILAELWPIAEAADEASKQWEDVTDHRLKTALGGFRERFRRAPEGCDEFLPEALGAVREAASRQLGMRPFLVQLVGAVALHKGYLAEMATGEGKTMTAGIAAVLMGWTGRPCHVVTVNDYLVKRDAEWMRQLFSFCRVREGIVTSGMSPEERREGYRADVTYSTSRELLADFLRDGLRRGTVRHPTRRLIRRLLTPGQGADPGIVMRGLHTAIVDEADSVLIDEAVTPLIISTPRENAALEVAIRQAHEIVAGLKNGEDYSVDVKYREIELTPRGRGALEGLRERFSGLWKSRERSAELIRQALVAREFYLPGKQYIVVDDKVVIVDEFTGRAMPNRSWRQGVHQAIECKEGLPITDPSETVARLSFQRFFRLYRRMSGMTGTAREAASELWHIYRLPTITIPANRPCIREQWEDRIFEATDEKWEAIVQSIQDVHRSGRPILIGTRSVADSEVLADRLRATGLAFQLLNATRHEEEAHIIARTGTLGRITIATNMAGRGTDIRLDADVVKAGGLHVIATARHESGRVDRQLFGRSARQGDPGSAQMFASFEDELVQRHLERPVSQAIDRLIARGPPMARWAMEQGLRRAQRKAERFAFRQRRGVLRMDTWLDEALSFAGETE